MRISFNDRDGHRGHILGVHETVCDVVLHMRFLMRNGGHYTAFFLYLTLFNSNKKDFGEGKQTFSHAEHYQDPINQECCIVTTMEAHISVITLGVLDLEKSTGFYCDDLGLPTKGIIGTEFKGDETHP
jgi:hypothetical protein